MYITGKLPLVRCWDKKMNYIYKVKVMQLSTIFQLYRGGQILLVKETGENHRPVASH
jgi:hypothetical protein